MKAALRVKPKSVNCVEIPEPEIKPYEVLIKVDSVGICGSDINRIAEDNEKWNKVVLGHEFAGIVIKTGSNVTNIKVKDRVSAAPLIPCHVCDKCRQGLFSLCKNYTFIGSRLNGAMAEYVAVPEENVLPLPGNLSFENAALIEPIAVCLHPILPLKNMLGRDVLITGAGTIGLLALQIFKVMGARHVIVSDIVENKLNIAKKLGADITINVMKEPLKNALKNSLENNTGGEVDLVFESSGSNPAKKSAIEAVKGKGLILQVGTSPADITFEANLYEQITRKELEIRGSWMNYSAPFPGPEWTLAVWLLQSGLIKVKELITHYYPLSEIGKAYDMIFGNKEEFIKVIIKP